MKKFFKRGMLAIALIASMTFAAPQQVSAEGINLPPAPQLGFKLPDIKLEIITFADRVFIVCIDGNTGKAIWARVLGGNNLDL